MKDGIRIEVVWFDNDVIALQVDGSNERFAGSVELYASHDSFSQLAKNLRGFPASTMDVRELGTFDETNAGGGVRMQFLSTDNVGHAAVKMIMRADPRMSNGITETAVFQVGGGTCRNR